MNRKIIVPTDFTRAASQAIRQAIAIASRAGWSVTLLHVHEGTQGDIPGINEQMEREVEIARQKTGFVCQYTVRSGPVQETIRNAVCDGEYDLMVIGTHGARTIRQMIFGADIVKLVATISIPVLVVQEESPLIEEFRKIVLPVGSHETYMRSVEAVVLFGSIYDLEVHLYSIQKPGFDWPIQMLTNIEETRRILEERGIRMVRVKEEQDDHSAGFERQTLRYARSIGADTLWMMSVPSQDYYYLSKAYKEAMLMNDHHLPVLCAGGMSCT